MQKLSSLWRVLNTYLLKDWLVYYGVIYRPEDLEWAGGDSSFPGSVTGNYPHAHFICKMNVKSL